MGPTTASITVKDGDVLKERFKVERLIGKGSFGHVFLGKDLLHNGRNVAIKVQAAPLTWFLNPFSQLHVENMILTQLGGGKLNPYSRASGGFPKVHYFGTHKRREIILVMDQLGPSLQSLFTICERQFSLKTVLIIMDQLLYRLQYLHEKGFIHRDLKPDNILMGANAKSVDIVHLIDFGLSTTYWADPNTKEHVQESHKRPLGGRIGTARYMSQRCHQRYQTSRRDDMESLAYILAYFLKGSLNWQNVAAATSKQKNDKIAEIKMSITPEKLFEGFPSAFAEYLKCVKRLTFEETPKYKLYHRMFRELGKPRGIVYWRGGQFDCWTLIVDSRSDVKKTIEKKSEEDNGAVDEGKEAKEKKE